MFRAREEERVSPAKCVVCGGEIAEAWQIINDDAQFLARCWCRNCGLMYRFPPNTREAPNE